MTDLLFEGAIEVLRAVAKGEGRKLDADAARRSIKNAAQAYLYNKKMWSRGPAKIRDAYVNLRAAFNRACEEQLKVLRDLGLLIPLLSAHPERDPDETVKDVRRLVRALEEHDNRLLAAELWAADRVRPGNTRGSAAEWLAIVCGGIFERYGAKPTTATHPKRPKEPRYSPYIDFFTAVLNEVDPEHGLRRPDEIAHKAHLKSLASRKRT